MKITLNTLQNKYQNGEKIVMLTCYDASFSHVMDEAGIDILLVGDSLGNVIQGVNSTLFVTIDDMVYHTRLVARGAQGAFILSDLPFGSYQKNKEQAFYSAARLMQAGVNMVKLEGGAYMAETTRFLVERGIPVCAHIGLTPQMVNTIGGYRVQGRTDQDVLRLLSDAQALAEAGASLVLMECVPSLVANKITESISVPTIGIGAGRGVSGQVLVVYDMLGLYPGKKAKFVKDFMAEANSIQDAIKAYATAVRNGSFPAEAHAFH